MPGIATALTSVPPHVCHVWLSLVRRAKYPGCKVECGPALDLMSQPSVKAFAQAILKRPGGLHILVNNAGLGYCKKSFTDEGVGMLTQVRSCQPGYSK
jgi:hypothetical protein